MREIKFRVWDPITESIYNNVGIDKIHLYDFKGDDITEQDALVIMQYTGLMDRNGKEIYAGDIVKFTSSGFFCYDEEIAEVTWGTGEYVLAKNDDVLESLNETYENGTCDCEVIGNIYENPELVSE